MTDELKKNSQLKDDEKIGTGFKPTPADAEEKEESSSDSGLPATAALFEKSEEALREFEKTDRKKVIKDSVTVLSNMWKGFFIGFLRIRDEPTIWGRIIMALFCVVSVLIIWFMLTRGGAEQRVISPQVLGSPEEVFGSFGSLWFDRALMRNLLVSLWRVIKGFALASLVAIPLGILCGTFKRIDAFFAPISIFGRNIPIVTLVPLTLMWFGLGEGQKVAFIFLSCFAFVMFDAARSVANVDKDYLDTAYTLGASRRQVIMKVLVPLAMPDIFNSIRLLFGIAFGYIILAEMIDMNTGIGKLILVSQRRGPREHVYLILFCITLTAFIIDRTLYIIQRNLFAYRFKRQ